ncbi:MAG TPA: enolase C-terminal domain-like protein [Terracidiphilus sp.]|jgi:L-rhamnonate dehydratase|nr:enolase C-terminal domain-like protein [Terracidiphilus sp.]
MSAIIPGVSRRRFLSALTAMTAAAGSSAAIPTAAAAVPGPDHPDGQTSLKIDSVELIELRGHYLEESGVDHQWQVNPLDVYDEFRRAPYRDKPAGKRDVQYEAIYIRIRTSAGLDGLYGPIEREAAAIVLEDLQHFLVGKDALAGEVLWDQMYRSNRQSRAGIFMMAISACDNALWDLRGKFYGVPVWRLLGGPSRDKVEVYASALGFSLELEDVRHRAIELKNEGFRYQKWFMGYGPGSGPEGMAKNVELVKTLRETLGDDYEIMFDAYSGWDQDYALEWAKRVEQYRPFWMEEVTHPEKIDSFAAIRRGTTVPLASGEHFYGRWEVERYLQANTLNVVQADPEWCGGVSELVKIGTVASLHDVRVIPHGHSLRAAIHVILSQSPMTFPLGEYLIIKMRNYMHFEKNPVAVDRAHIARPTGPGFDIQLDQTKIESQKLLTIS